MRQPAQPDIIIRRKQQGYLPKRRFARRDEQWPAQEGIMGTRLTTAQHQKLPGAHLAGQFWRMQRQPAQAACRDPLIRHFNNTLLRH